MGWQDAGWGPGVMATIMEKKMENYYSGLYRDYRVYIGVILG